MKIVVTKEELRVNKEAAKYLAGEFDVCIRSVWSSELHAGRRITLCVIHHNYNYYSGVSVLHPYESASDKGIKLAFGRALNTMIADVEYQLRCYFGKGINKVFWEKFLTELSSNNE